MHLLDSADAGEGPQVGVGDPGESGVNRLEEITRGFKAGVGAMVTFGGEAHGGAVGAAGFGVFVVARLSSAKMP